MNFKQKFKKSLSIVLMVSLVVGYSLPNVSFAEGENTVEQPAQTSETQIDNSATVENSATTSSDTGNNTINPTPASDAADATPSPEETPSTDQAQTADDATATAALGSGPPDTSDTASDSVLALGSDPSLNITATNSAEVTNSISSTSETGENSITPEESENTDSQTESLESETATESAINTGDAVSETSLQNTINSNSIDSEVVYQTVNIFVEENGNINLSDPFTIAAAAISEREDQSVINISVISVSNYTYLSNDIVSTANTGVNTINGAGEAVINTGDAYSVVSLLNQVNFTIINSKLHVVSINIFGKLNGNIILPDINTSTACDGCGVFVNIENNANLTNSVDSTAVTGQNSIERSGEITTGNAQSSVNNINLVNMNLVGVNAQVLYITLFGTWNGNFIGWGNFPAQAGGASLVFIYLGPANGNSNGCLNCSGNINIQNTALVTNNISSLANTGGNSINGSGSIQTGQAFSAVSLINFINTNFINSIGFFGFINIFGDWVGDIGGESNFEALENKPPQDQSGGSPNGELTDGYLEVSQTNNVGEYVMPGDTITFFIKVKNPSNGDVHDTKLYLSLIKDGVNVGGAYFDLGNISPSKAVRVTTGLVLSKDAPGGTYVARAYAEGITGEESNTVSSYADSTFAIFGEVVQNLIVGEAQASGNSKEVLGNKTVNKPKAPIADYAWAQMLFLALLLLLLYALLRKIRQNPNWAVVLAKKAKDRKKSGRLGRKSFKEGG